MLVKKENDVNNRRKFFYIISISVSIDIISTSYVIILSF